MTTTDLLIILRQRLKSVTAQLDALKADQATVSDIRQLLNAGWIDAMGVEQAFLADLIGRLEREGVQL